MSFKYIGIRGHRGAGKQTISYLLGVCLDYYMQHKSFNGFNDIYKSAVDRVHQDEEFLMKSDFRRVQFVGFADNPKIMLAQLIGVPTEWMWDDWKKDSVFIDMKSFEIHSCKDKLEMYHWKGRSYTASELVENSQNGFDNKSWISLRELIIYFGKYTMQRMFGQNVWIKSLNANKYDMEHFYADNKTVYRIFVDCKFKSEITYIYNNNGTIIEISRPDCVKDNSEISDELEGDSRSDYKIQLEPDNLEGLQHTLEKITLEIINK